MRAMKLLFTGAAIGASAVYWFDPDGGARRRALARGKLVRFAGELVGGADAGARDIAHRVHGMTAHARGLLRDDERVSDSVLHERVRAALGHVAHHPHGITARADGGVVTLSGSVLAGEHTAIVRHVARVNGVKRVHDSMTSRATEGAEAASRGEPRLRRRLATPAGRLILGSGAMMLLAAMAPVLLVPLSVALGIGLAARNEERHRARRRGAVRWATSAEHLVTPDSQVKATPTGQVSPVPPSPQ